jgi:hypothetical protein
VENDAAEGGAMNWTETIERYIREGRPVSGGKGQDVAQQQQQAELAMQQQAFQTQQSQLAALNKAFSQYTTGAGQGFTPQQMSSMTSQFLNNNNSTFNQAGQQVRAALGARGSGTGQQPVGGDYTRGISSLIGAKAGSQSQGLLGLNVTNAQQALQNKFNAGSLLSGNAATLTGTQGVAGAGASSALNSYIQGINAPGFLQSLGTSLASGIGSGIGAGVTGGLGTVASSVGSGNFGW